MKQLTAVEREGLQWLARQLAWERRLEQLHGADAGVAPADELAARRDHDLAA